MFISVVILNFNRPSFIKNNIIPELEKIDLIDEILISHGKEETYFESKSKKIKNFKHWGEYNEKYGLVLRFITANEAKNDKIIIMDDDIIPYENTIEKLNSLIEKDKNRLYGLYGRNIDLDNKYIIENVFGNVPIVLTRLLITTKEMIKYFLDNFRNYENDVIKNSKPFWNGEDILFSLLSIKKYNNLPFVIDSNHYNRLSNYLSLGEAISTGNNNHKLYRENMTKELKDKLKVKEKIKTETKIEKRKSQFSYFFFNSILVYFPIIIIVIFLLIYYVYIKYK